MPVIVEANDPRDGEMRDDMEKKMVRCEGEREKRYEEKPVPLFVDLVFVFC